MEGTYLRYDFFVIFGRSARCEFVLEGRGQSLETRIKVLEKVHEFRILQHFDFLCSLVDFHKKKHSNFSRS